MGAARPSRRGRCPAPSPDAGNRASSGVGRPRRPGTGSSGRRPAVARTRASGTPRSTLRTAGRRGYSCPGRPSRSPTPNVAFSQRSSSGSASTSWRRTTPTTTPLTLVTVFTSLRRARRGRRSRRLARRAARERARGGCRARPSAARSGGMSRSGTRPPRPTPERPRATPFGLAGTRPARARRQQAVGPVPETVRGRRSSSPPSDSPWGAAGPAPRSSVGPAAVRWPQGRGERGARPRPCGRAYRRAGRDSPT